MKSVLNIILYILLGAAMWSNNALAAGVTLACILGFNFLDMSIDARDDDWQ